MTDRWDHQRLFAAMCMYTTGDVIHRSPEDQIHEGGSMSSENSVKSVCIVEIRVACGSTWGGNTTMDQIIKQSEAEATGRIEKLFSDAGKDDKELSVKRDGAQGLTFMGIKKIVTQAVSDRQ
jgi:hypothetical protein